MPDNEPSRLVRAPPYIYSRDELRRLFDPATVEISRRGAVQLDAVTFRALLLLLYGAGLRFGEATRLSLADVDLANAVLTIRATKFYKSRLVPVGPQLAAVLDRHVSLRRRDGLCPTTRTPFCWRTGTERGSPAAPFRRRVRHFAAHRRGPAAQQADERSTPARSSGTASRSIA